MEFDKEECVKEHKAKDFSLTDKEIKILILGLRYIPMHVRFLNMSSEEIDESIKKLANKLAS